jgi:hypothetical protein
MAVKNRKKFNDRYVVVLYENLILNDKQTLIEICDQIDLKFDEGMLVPTFGNKVWGGNSSFGKMPAKVSAQNLEKYREVLNQDEQDRVDAALKEIYDAIDDGINDDDLIAKIEAGIENRMDSSIIDSTDLRLHFNGIYSQMREMQIR